MVFFVRGFEVAQTVLAATLDGLIAPYEPTVGHLLTICGPWTQAKRFEPAAKVPELLKDAHVWLAGANHLGGS